MKTSGYVMQGLPNPDGHIFVPINPSNGTSNPGVRTRLGYGLVATVQPASTSSIYEIALSELMFRYGMQDDSQLLFGRPNGQSGANAQPMLPGTVFQSPYSNQPRPPIPSANVFAGSTAPIPKGITLNAISIVYQPLGVGLVSALVGITKTQFGNGTAPVVSNILPLLQNGLSGAVAAQPVITTIPIPTANQVMLTSRFAEYVIELDMTTAAGGTINLFGFFLDISYNWN